MPAPTTIRELVTQSIQTEWESRVHASGELEITVYDNDPRVLPDTGTRARLVVLFGGRTKVSLGSLSRAVYRQAGQVIAQLFGDLNVGPAPLGQVFFRIDQVFRTRGLLVGTTAVRFLTPEPNELGNVDGAYRVNVVVPFWFDEFLPFAT